MCAICMLMFSATLGFWNAQLGGNGVDSNVPIFKMADFFSMFSMIFSFSLGKLQLFVQRKLGNTLCNTLCNDLTNQVIIY